MKISSIAFISCLGAVSAFGLPTTTSSSAVKTFRGQAVASPAFALKSEGGLVRLILHVVLRWVHDVYWMFVVCCSCHVVWVRLRNEIVIERIFFSM
jgi:hypothetical protein